jgi:hypothetical protein
MSLFVAMRALIERDYFVGSKCIENRRDRVNWNGRPRGALIEYVRGHGSRYRNHEEHA